MKMSDQIENSVYQDHIRILISGFVVFIVVACMLSINAESRLRCVSIRSSSCVSIKVTVRGPLIVPMSNVTSFCPSRCTLRCVGGCDKGALRIERPLGRLENRPDSEAREIGESRLQLRPGVESEAWLVCPPRRTPSKW